MTKLHQHTLLPWPNSVIAKQPDTLLLVGFILWSPNDQASYEILCKMRSKLRCNWNVNSSFCSENDYISRFEKNAQPKTPVMQTLLMNQLNYYNRQNIQQIVSPHKHTDMPCIKNIIKVTKFSKHKIPDTHMLSRKILK